MPKRSLEISYNFYTFSGLIPGRPHGDLHITSVKFDEPECLRIVGASKVVVAIHGRADKLHDTAKTVDPKTIFMGGLDVDLRDSIADRLNRAGFQAKAGNPDYPGEQPFNICNRGRNKGGVQLEIPRTLRNDLQLQPNRLSAFASAVRQAMESRP